MSAGLTPRMKEAFDFIDGHIKRTDGVSPSYEEIADALKLKSKANVFRLVAALRGRGFIGQMKGRARSFSILKRPGYEQGCRCPHCGGAI